MKKEIIIKEGSGAIKFIEGSIVISDFNINVVIAIGEVATATGPFQSTHYLLFITRTKFCHSIPTDSNGFNNLIEYVGSTLDISTFIRLANVTSYKSRLVYPKEFEGIEFMKTQVIKTRNILDRLLMMVGLRDSRQVIMTTEAQKIILPELKLIEE